jgi:uncharacterized protein (TIGR02172 family)
VKKGKLIGQGRTAEIYSLEDDKVLKLFRESLGHKSVEQEYLISKVVAEAGVPAPRIYEMVQVDGRQGIVCQHVQGQTMLDIIAGKPYRVLAEGRRLAQLHHQIHDCHITSLPSQKETLAAFISRASILERQHRDHILTYLARLSGGTTLCHGDFHPDNIIISPQGASVIDWQNATSGNPAADVARSSLLLRSGAPPPGTTGLEAGLLNLLRSGFYKAYIREYYRVSDLNPEQVDAWTLPVAAARLAEDLPGSEKQILLNIVLNKLKS